MDFTVSAEHKVLQETLRTFYEKEAPTSVISELDRTETFPAEIFAGMARLGLCGMTFGEEYGGSDADEISICIAMEETARAAGCLIYAWGPSTTFCAKGLARFGTEEQKRRILPEVAAGRERLCMGLSEPDVGSDLGNLSTRAVRDGTDWIVTGQKIFTTGADTADYIFALVRTDPKARTGRAMSVLIVPRRAPA